MWVRLLSLSEFSSLLLVMMIVYSPVATSAHNLLNVAVGRVDSTPGQCDLS